MRYVYHLYDKLERMATHMDVTDCAVFITCVLVIGFVCLRGFGSRTNW
jgi:hypothetical protein